MLGTWCSAHGSFQWPGCLKIAQEKLRKDETEDEGWEEKEKNVHAWEPGGGGPLSLPRGWSLQPSPHTDAHGLPISWGGPLEYRWALGFCVWEPGKAWTHSSLGTLAS